MKKEVIILALSLTIGFALSALVAVPLGMIYILIWTDKLLLRSFLPLRYTGIELTTMASVFAGLIYGPWTAFLLVVISAPLIRVLRFYALPIREPDFPIFLPHPYAVVDAIGGFVAGTFVSWGLVGATLVVIAFKFFAYGFTTMLMFGRGFGAISGLIFALFNVFLLLYAGQALAGFVGFALA